jgi:hypothetical protein
MLLAIKEWYACMCSILHYPDVYCIYRYIYNSTKKRALSVDGIYILCHMQEVSERYTLFSKRVIDKIVTITEEWPY